MITFSPTSLYTISSSTWSLAFQRSKHYGSNWPRCEIFPTWKNRGPQVVELIRLSQLNVEQHRNFAQNFRRPKRRTKSLSNGRLHSRKLLRTSQWETIVGSNSLHYESLVTTVLKCRPCLPMSFNAWVPHCSRLKRVCLSLESPKMVFMQG